MGRSSGYGRVGGRRSSGGAWQWLVIGLTLGLGCSVIFVLILLTLGVFNLDAPATQVAVVNTNTPPPTEDIPATVQAVVDATIAAQPQAAPPTPTTEQAEAPPVIVAPTATDIASEPPTQEPEPTDEPAALEPTGDDDPDTTATQTAPLQVSGLNAQSSVPPELQPFISETVRVDGGTFLMGTTPSEVAVAVRECSEDPLGGNCLIEYGEDSTPAHSVTLDTFEIEQTEVTNGQYVAFLNWMGPGRHSNGCGGFQCVDTRSTQEFSVIVFDSQNYDVSSPVFINLPVVGVTWYGAQAYCEAIGRRLPTEAEWERAARGEDSRRYPWGDNWDVSLARTNRPDPSDVGAVEVGSYPLGASPYGVLDMAGNVAEWVADWYSPTFYSQPAAQGVNPTGPVSGTDKVLRGGSWNTPPFFARTVHRQHYRPNETFLFAGFRCAADFDESGAFPSAGTTGIDPFTLGTQAQDEADAEPTEPSIDAAPTLPPVSLPSPAPEATNIPAVPPGG